MAKMPAGNSAALFCTCGTGDLSGGIHRVGECEYANVLCRDNETGFVNPVSKAVPEDESEELETLSAKLHDIYQEEAKRQAKELGRPIRHDDDYYKLGESTKEYDRVLARFILSRDAARDALAEACIRWDEAGDRGDGMEMKGTYSVMCDKTAAYRALHDAQGGPRDPQDCMSPIEKGGA